MNGLVFFLIIFFLFLILYQFVQWMTTFREGAKNNSSSKNSKSNTNSTKNNSSTQDASGNSLSNLEQTVNDLSGNVANLQTQVNGLVQAQQQYTNQMAPSEPNVTGVDNPNGNN